MLSGGKRKVFDTLIELEKPATPKEIAEKARLEKSGDAYTQLRRLEKDGYVISRRMGKTTKYEVRERLFRLWRELRRQPFAMQKLSILVEFLELWYSPEERKEKFLEDFEHLEGAVEETRARETSYWFSSLPKEYKKELIPRVVKGVSEVGKVKLLDELVYGDKELKAEAAKAEFMILLEKGNYEELLKKAEEMIKVDKNDVFMWVIKSVTLGELKRYEEALEASSKSVELNPVYADAWFNKGWALGNLGRYEEALEALSKSIELNPDNASAWFYKGIALRDLDRPEEALDALSKSTELNPGDAAAWFYKGMALGKLERHEEALEAFSKNIELNPDNAAAWFYYKGLALYNLERPEVALEALSKTIELNPDNAAAWLIKGEVLRKLDKDEEALEAFSKSLELNTEVADTWLRKGLALGTLGKYKESVAALSKALELNHDDTYTLYLKGLLHLKISLQDFKSNNYGNALTNLPYALGALDNFNTSSKDKEKAKEKRDEVIMAFLRSLIDTKNVEAVDMALEAIGKNKKEFRVLFEPITTAVEIAKSKDVSKFYNLQVERREVVADIVKKLTGSEELLPEEYKGG